MFEVCNIAFDERHIIQGILEEEGLCHNDIHNDIVQLFEVKSNMEVVGYFGYERYNTSALFRSIVVVKAFRRKGFGSKIWHLAKERLINEKVEQIFLLTNTAAPFFKSQGFYEIPRDSVPEEIASTTEFMEFCPSDSTCMMINLAENEQRFY